MDRADLKLVVDHDGREAHLPAGPRSAVLALGAAILAAAVLAGLMGADRGRRPPRSGEIAQAALDAAFASGASSPAVRESLVQLRARLGRSPLDATTRVLYAGLLLEYAATEGEGRAAAFHAARAAEFAPVTVPVVRGAALVLARTGRREESIALVRAMFGYEPREAAALLARMRTVIGEDGIEQAVPQEPDAWLAWITQLRASGEQAEADARLERAHETWPDSWPVLLAATQRALGRGDWERVRSLLSPDLSIPPGPGRSILLAYRARARASSGDLDGARADARAALRGTGADPATAYSAGLALEAAGEATEARGVWERALYALEQARGDRHLQAALLAALARLEDRHGRPADALRLWRSVLEIDPRHAEARRRVDDLTNFRR